MCGYCWGHSYIEGQGRPLPNSAQPVLIQTSPSKRPERNAVDIYMIWRREDDVIWLHGAWDDETISENREGYEADIAKAEAEGETRIVKASVDFEAVTAAFAVPSVALRLDAQRQLPQGAR